MRRGIILAVLLGVHVAAFGVTVGDPAPSIVITDWIKGGPLDSLDPRKITVLEVWATWCPACVAHVPYMTAVQRAYANQVQVLAVSDEPASTVAAFVNAQGSNMEYTVACDTTGLTNYNYDVYWIPNAYIIDQKGILLWEGYPSDMDAALEAAVDAMLKFTVEPVGGFTEVGASHTFSVAASGGTGTLTYTWYKDGVEVGTGPTFAIASLTEADAGTYRCDVEDEDGLTLSSRSASIEVFPANSVPVSSCLGLWMAAGVLAAIGGRKTAVRRR